MLRLPKIIGDSWFNLPAGKLVLGPEDLKDKVLLIDFWTYSCVNCQRTLSYLRDWWRKYKDNGLVIIGIHTPEFEFEKDHKNVERAIEDLMVEWPVVQDNDRINWNNFSNHYWPAKYLFDQDGRLTYEHFGEGNYEETEVEIRKLLGGARNGDALIEHAHGNVCFIPTPETYCGYERGRLANVGGYVYDRKHSYNAPKELPRDLFALEGEFIARPQYVESAATGAVLALHFHATEANLVFHPVSKEAIIEVLFDNEAVPPEIRGQDVSEAGEVKIIAPTLYNLIKSDGLTEGVLSVRAKKGNFRAYAFTFSGCEQ